jgi:hypothetical protein
MPKVSAQLGITDATNAADPTSPSSRRARELAWSSESETGSLRISEQDPRWPSKPSRNVYRESLSFRELSAVRAGPAGITHGWARSLVIASVVWHVSPAASGYASGGFGAGASSLLLRLPLVERARNRSIGEREAPAEGSRAGQVMTLRHDQTPDGQGSREPLLAFKGRPTGSVH